MKELISSRIKAARLILDRSLLKTETPLNTSILESQIDIISSNLHRRPVNLGKSNPDIKKIKKKYIYKIVKQVHNETLVLSLERSQWPNNEEHPRITKK